MQAIVLGDALRLPFADKSFQAIVTSPPYWGLRTYGDSELEIGQGSFIKYMDDMEQHFRSMWEALDDTGVLWWNCGDTASGSGGAGGDYTSGGKAGKALYKQGKPPVRAGQWCLVPERVAMMAQEMGWYLRHRITWDKGVLRPESLAHAGRPGVSSEPIYMFTKAKSGYKFLEQHLTERGDVWHFPPSKGKQHLAPFPDELVRRCLECTTEPGDRVLDPFNGSGTTTRVAESMGRIGFGVELYPATLDQAASHESDMFALADDTY